MPSSNRFHIEIMAEKTERAVRFYARVFDWDLKQDEDAAVDYWFASPKEHDATVSIGITERQFEQDTTVITYGVSSVDGFAQRVVDAGGTVYGDGPTIIPGVGYLRYCEDTEGNSFGILQYDDKAS
jgi:predicted enzyme related to lactoylglutathione lyase